jgi:hypothetical protein
LIDSGAIEPNIKKEFSSKSDAENYVINMMSVATFMAVGYKNYPRVYQNKDGKWIGAIFQIPG